MEPNGKTTSHGITLPRVYIADLAKSTLHMNAEAVYEGPADSNSKSLGALSQSLNLVCCVEIIPTNDIVSFSFDTVYIQ